jgi:indolepyruvate ferredoxin oxidoreductase beta subunit
VAEKRTALLIVGVGGQGVLTASQILGEAAHAAGIPVVVGELHGLSQRGGSVECSVLFGPGKSSFLPVADVLVGFEPLEALRARGRVSDRTKVLVNEGRIMLSELRGQAPYPSLRRVLAEIHGISSEVVVVKGRSAALQVGHARTLNVVMLGALAGLGWLPFDETTLWHSVARRCRARYREANRRALALGRSLVGGESREAEGSEPENEALKRG